MWALIYSALIDRRLRNIRLYTLWFSGIKAGNRVLDVCCGTGDQVFHYGQRGAIATGIDLNQGMIKLAMRKKAKKGLENVSFQIADALNLPFKNNSFDYASISFALHETERTARDKIISEMKRVVKKEGALIFLDLSAPLPKNRFRYFIQAMEFIAGGDHFSYFKDYFEQGGIDEILKKNQVRQEKRRCLNSGIIAIIKTRNS